MLNGGAFEGEEIMMNNAGYQRWLSADEPQLINMIIDPV